MEDWHSMAICPTAHKSESEKLRFIGPVHSFINQLPVNG